MSLVRCQNWEHLFAEALATREASSFCYGVHDCCVSGCVLLQAITGQDFTLLFDRYDDEAGAQAIMGNYGGVEGIADHVARQVGAEPVTKGFCRRGDAVLIDTPLGIALGVVDLTGRSVVVPGGHGWERLPLLNAIRGWRIG